VLNLFECESEEGWMQLSTSILAAPHHAVIDAIFGTGLTRPVEGIQLNAIQYMNGLRRKRDLASTGKPLILSIDIPSGLNADSERPIGEAVHADATVTMTAPKRANVLPPACDYNGQLTIADIDSPAQLIAEARSQTMLTEAEDARRWLSVDNRRITRVHGSGGALRQCRHAGRRRVGDRRDPAVSPTDRRGPTDARSDDDRISRDRSRRGQR
jgi:hypothetical protein